MIGLWNPSENFNSSTTRFAVCGSRASDNIAQEIIYIYTRFGNEKIYMRAKKPRRNKSKGTFVTFGGHFYNLRNFSMIFGELL